MRTFSQCWSKSLLTRSISDFTLTHYLILPQCWNQMSFFSVINLFAWRFRGSFSIPSIPSPEMRKFPQAQFSHKVKSGTMGVLLLMNFCCWNKNRTLFLSEHKLALWTSLWECVFACTCVSMCIKWYMSDLPGRRLTPLKREWGSLTVKYEVSYKASRTLLFTALINRQTWSQLDTTSPVVSGGTGKGNEGGQSVGLS